MGLMFYLTGKKGRERRGGCASGLYIARVSWRMEEEEREWISSFKLSLPHTPSVAHIPILHGNHSRESGKITF